MCNATEYMKLKIAADKATAKWLENDNETNFAAMVYADDCRIAAEAEGWNIIKINETTLTGMMGRSVFGAADRTRAARAA